MKQLLCIHGYNGHPMSAWKPWLKKEAEKAGYKTHFPSMKNSEHPVPVEWIAQIATIVQEPDSNWTLVGHSLGAPAILRFLDTLEDGQEVGTVILIAGFYADLGDHLKVLRAFTDKKLDWQRIRSHAWHFVVVHSKDDDWVPVQFGIDLAMHLRVEPIIVDKYKHFSTDDGIAEIPFLLAHL